MKRIFAIAISAILLVNAPLARADTRTEFVRHVYNSVVLLYAQGADGGMQMRCTATAYRRLDKGSGYRLASASHCVSGDTETEQKNAKYFITADSNGPKTFMPASLVMAGDKSRGDDFSIFEIRADVQLDVTPLGDSDKVLVGEAVISVASPLGLGKQFFSGNVSCVLVDRPPLDAGDVQWRNIMLVDISAGPGSSGSAIVSEDQQAIIGFLVGSFNANIGSIVLPAAKFKAFEEAVDKGTYKKSGRSHDKNKDKDDEE